MKNYSEEILTDNSGRENVACVACFAPNTETADFCRNCGAPLGETSTIDPIKSIRAEGFLLQKATSGKPKLIVLLGIWIIFLPVFLASGFLALAQAVGGKGFAGFVFFWIGIAFVFFAGKMLYTVTGNYLKTPAKDTAEDVENPAKII